MPAITLSGLVQRVDQRLELQWEAQLATDPVLTDGDAGNDAIHSLVGHMNVIYPHKIQILGQDEITYLKALHAATLEDILQRLTSHNTTAIIFADDQAPDARITASASASNIAVLKCRQTADEAIELIQQLLRDLITNQVIVHGVFMEVIGIGVLITGASGIGKSELALELLSRGHRLIADDAPQFSSGAPNSVTGTCPRALQDFMEVRGLGILNVRAMFGDSAIKRKKDLRLVVELQEMSDKQLAHVERVSVSQKRNILGVDLPLVTIPVAPGRNLAIIVESAARNQILLNKGYNAAEAFSRQQRSIMENPES